jgi:hypothetical protein
MAGAEAPDHPRYFRPAARPTRMTLDVDSLRLPSLSGVEGRADSSRTSRKWR